MVFLQGFLRKMARRCGVFVVRMWWNVWQPWSADCTFFGSEIYATFQGFFPGRVDAMMGRRSPFQGDAFAHAAGTSFDFGTAGGGLWPTQGAGNRRHHAGPLHPWRGGSHFARGSG